MTFFVIVSIYDDVIRWVSGRHLQSRNQPLPKKFHNSASLPRFHVEISALIWIHWDPGASGLVPFRYIQSVRNDYCTALFLR